MSLAQRVAARHVLGAFIPDKFFKDWEADFKTIAVEPLPDGLATAVHFMKTSAIPLLEHFRKEVISLAPVSRPAIDALLRPLLASVKETYQAYYDSSAAVDYPWPTSQLECVMGHIGEVVNEKVSKEIKTLGKALKTPIRVDAAKVKAFAARALKQATPDEAAAVELRSSPVADAFYEKHVDGGISKLVKKGKADVDLVKWLATVRTTLSNYATGKGRYLEFDLGGMKVVIDDWSVGPSDHDKYVKQLDTAHQLLKRKKLDRAWYGTTFIQCDGCGGEVEGHGDVGGDYLAEEDTVRVYQRPSRDVASLMIHELGHRYWYKSMSQGQRAKFEGLVLIRGERPGGERQLLDPDALEGASDNVKEHRHETLKVLDLCEVELTSGKGNAEQLRSRVGGKRHDIGALVHFAVDPTNDLDGKGKALFNAVRQKVEAATAELTSAPEASPFENPSVVTAWRKWLAACREAVKEAAAAALTCMHYAAQSYEARESASRTPEQVAWDEDPRTVLPVSGYGKTNISEAFAEAFMFYVMGTTMSADQEASFKAVLLDKDRTASKVAARWSLLAITGCGRRSPI